MIRSTAIVPPIVAKAKTLSSPPRKLITESIAGVKPILFTCEHAGQEEYGLSRNKQLLFKTNPNLQHSHWAYDPGAANLTKDLCKATQGAGVLFHISRLYCDVNRPVGSHTLARLKCDGVPVEINTDMDDTERKFRVNSLWTAYHLRAAKMAASINARIIASIHTFTPEYEGKRRDHVEIGVLSSFDDKLALKIIDKLKTDGFEKVLHNEPWSGKQGLMFSADMLGHSYPNRQTVMIEVRNDLLTSAPNATEYQTKLVQSLKSVLLNEL